MHTPSFWRYLLPTVVAIISISLRKIFMLILCIVAVVWVIPWVPVKSVLHVGRVICRDLHSNTSWWSCKRLSLSVKNIYRNYYYQKFPTYVVYVLTGIEKDLKPRINFKVLPFSFVGRWRHTTTLHACENCLWAHNLKVIFQGYLIGNGATDQDYDFNSFVPFAHGMGLISTELFEVKKSMPPLLCSFTSKQ